MNDKQKTALESLVNRTLSTEEIQEIDPHLPNRRDDLIAEILSRNRVKHFDLFVSERGVIAKYPHGALEADALLTKLEVFSEVQGNPLASLVRRALRFLRQSEGLNIGEPTTRLLISALVQNQILTNKEGEGLFTMSKINDPIDVNKVSNALNVAEERMIL